MGAQAVQVRTEISSGAAIGMALTADALTSALNRVQEVGLERAAGEWQAEWQVLPQLAVLASSALALRTELVEDLVVYPEAMRHNLTRDGSLLTAEASMMALAPELGRETAHDLVYRTARDVRAHPSFPDPRKPQPLACPETLTGDLRLKAGRVGLRGGASDPTARWFQRLQGGGVVDVDDGVVAFGKAGVEVVALAFGGRLVDDADGAFEARAAQDVGGGPALVGADEQFGYPGVVQEFLGAAG